jgi:hypothetical protein
MAVNRNIHTIMKRSVHRFFGIALVAATLLVAGSCLDTQDIPDPNVQLQKDIQTIDTYMISKGLTPYDYEEEEGTKIRFVIKKLGTRLPVRTTATKISADYKLYPIPPVDGQPAIDQGNITELLSNLIPAWQAAALRLPIGTIADIYTPSAWGYGTAGNSKIAANQPLLFTDFEIKSAEITPAEQTQFNTDTTAIGKYLREKKYTDVVYDLFDSVGLGIAYRVTTQGSGYPISWFSNVSFKVQYKLLSDDTRAVTDVLEYKPQENATDNRPVDHIQGLMLGLQQLRTGSKATFYIPSGLGFGIQGAQSGGATVIPANSNLIAEVEVISVSE